MVTRMYLTICLIAAVLPALPLSVASHSNASLDFPGWPQQFEGRDLKRFELSPKEKKFYSGFPGKAARFSDGQREIILRWVSVESRKLHSASECFKGLGYAIHPRDLELDAKGGLWGQFEASKNQTRLLVKERISDSAGNQWTDVSAWYWAALLGETQGPWWSVTVASTSLPQSED